MAATEHTIMDQRSRNGAVTSSMRGTCVPSVGIPYGDLSGASDPLQRGTRSSADDLRADMCHERKGKNANEKGMGKDRVLFFPVQ